MQYVDQYDPTVHLHTFRRIVVRGALRGAVLFMGRIVQKIQRVSVKKLFPDQTKRIHLLIKIDVKHFAAVSGKSLACRKEAFGLVGRLRPDKSKILKNHR